MISRQVLEDFNGIGLGIGLKEEISKGLALIKS